MSIHEALNILVRERRIVHVPPAIRGVSSARHLFLVAGVHERLMSAMTGNTSEDAAYARLYAALDAFTSGRMISIGHHPFEKDNSAFMARTNPPQEAIFDIRVHGIRNTPATRLFGAFCETDIFLGLTCKLRRNLGGRQERLFDQAILEAMREWDTLLPGHKRHYSERIEDHVSDNFHIV